MSASIQNDNMLRAWLTLLRAPSLGDRGIVDLIGEFDGAEGILSAAPRRLAEAGLKPAALEWLQNPDQSLIQTDLAWLAADDHHLVPITGDLYPPLLKRIPDPPAALFVNGNPDALLQPQLAVVGSRAATVSGLENARDFAATLARGGLAITSGLAAGIDAAAHEACLDAGGTTVAVLGTGPDRVYPARHKSLARRIKAGGGALVSGFPPGAEARPGHFPARNRVISGLSLGTLVVEAGLKSGSLITARLAAEQGREVFALPGSIHNPVARGCHRLIRQGAKLVETAAEIAEELAPLATELAGELKRLIADDAAAGVEGGEDSPHIARDPEYRRLLDAVGFDPTPVDTIIDRSELTAAAVSSMLLMLELEGWVAAHPGGRYSRIKDEPRQGPHRGSFE